MQHGAYGMNQTVINSVLPKLAPMIVNAKSTRGPLNLYTGMGGVPDWAAAFPTHGCNLTSSFAPCKWWCDGQSCDQCHPNDNGYHQLAKSFLQQMNLPPAPPTPPSPPPSPPGAWIYEQSGNGKLFLPAANFTANTNSGRKGALAWDACKGGAFDNGHPIFPPKAGCQIGGVEAGGSWTLVGADPCGRTFNYPNMSVSTPFSVDAGIRYEAFTYLEVV